jgi:hypothetical protein
MRAKEELPMVYLFSFNLKEIDYFGWGDILYFLASISSVIQAFFPFLPISDDFSCIYYIICKFLSCFYCCFVYPMLFAFLFFLKQMVSF